MKYTEVVSVEITAKQGASIGEAARDALKIAVDEWRNVNLKHNDKIYRVNVNDLFAVVIEER